MTILHRIVEDKVVDQGGDNRVVVVGEVMEEEKGAVEVGVENRV
jgi:hypothetical protein